MGKTYENEKGVHIETHTDKNGKDHISFYDKSPRDRDHESIHINWDSSTGKGTIVESDSSGKTTTDIGCFLTTACMRHYQNNFDDNCYELTVLRWFRDNFVSKEDIKHYYKTAPMIVSAIENDINSDMVYDYIYDNVVDACVEAIEKGDYEFAYNRYKNSILSLEQTYLKPTLQQGLVRVLKKQVATC